MVNKCLNKDYLLQNVTNMTIATDIICGFPTETKEDFDETLDLVNKYKFPVVNISQFYPRPGTVAAKWKRVDTKEVKRRSTAMAKLFTSYPNYNHLKGSIQRVWIHDTKDEGRNPDEETMVAHTKSYVKVLLKREQSLVGKQAIVKINDIFKWHVCGEIIDKNPKIINAKFQDHFKEMYNPEKEKTNLNQFSHIKKEQEDIHATIITSKPLIKEIKTINNKKDTINQFSGVILYLISLVFLYLGLSGILKDL